LSGATVQSNGTITPAVDQSSQACMSEPLIDVVFLGSMPAAIASTAPGTPARDCAIRQVLRCSKASQQKHGCTSQDEVQQPNSAAALCDQDTLTVGALGIEASTTKSDGSTTAPGLLSNTCNDFLMNVVPSLRSGFDAQRAIGDMATPDLAPAAMASAVAQM